MKGICPWCNQRINSKKEVALYLIKNGYSARSIGKLLDVAHTTVGRWAKE